MLWLLSSQGPPSTDGTPAVLQGLVVLLDQTALINPSPHWNVLWSVGQKFDFVPYDCSIVVEPHDMWAPAVGGANGGS